MVKVLVVDFGIVYGGQEIYSINLYKSLSATGSIVYERYGTLRDEGKIDLSYASGIKQVVLHANRIDSLASNFDLIHFNGNKAIQVSFFCKNKVKKVATKHAPFRKPGRSKLVTTIFKWTYSLLCSKLHRIICVAPITFQELQNLNSVYIPNGCGRKLADEIRTERSHSLINICFVARFTEEKGITILLNAILAISRSSYGPQIRFHLVGSGDLTDDVESFISTHRLNDYVVVHGFLADPTEVYSLSHFCVLPSLYEGMPLNILEAFSAKLPVVAFDIDNINQIITHNYNGILVDKSNFSYAKLADAFLELATDNDKLVRLGENAYDDYIQKYQLTTMVNRTMQILKETIRE